MKRLFFLLSIFMFLGCNNEAPKTNIHVIVINYVSYNLTEEAYNSLSAYLKFLNQYYISTENSEEINDAITTKIAEGLGQKLDNQEDAVTQSELEIIIEELKQQVELGQIPGVSVVPGLEDIEKAPLAIFAYLVANNNLNNALLVNIGAMYDGLAGMDKPATLMVYWDGKTKVGANNADHLILKYETDGKGNINGRPALDETTVMEDVLDEAIIVKEYASQLSTDKEVMKTVLKDMMANADSEKFGLIVGSHASSWLSSIFTSRAFGQDGSSTDNTMLIPDMAEALKSVGQKFEFILFDACYMGTTEVAYTFRDVANYQISSVMEVPAYGFPYDLLMQDLYEGTASSYQQVCQYYMEYYKFLYDCNDTAWGTIALIDSKEMGNLTDMIKQEVVAHKELLAEYDTGHLQEYGKSSGPYIAVDLGHFVKDMNGGSMPAAFSSQLAKTVLYKECMEKTYPYNYAVDADNYSGLGMYIPVAARPKWNTYFKTLDWYTAAGWNEVSFSWNF